MAGAVMQQTRVLQTPCAAWKLGGGARESVLSTTASQVGFDAVCSQCWYQPVCEALQGDYPLPGALACLPQPVRNEKKCYLLFGEDGYIEPHLRNEKNFQVLASSSINMARVSWCAAAWTMRCMWNSITVV